VILATGWTSEELAAQPARLVRAIAYRLFVSRIWSPELATAAATPVPREAFGSAQEWLDAIKRRDTAAAALRSVEAALWPEDSDGE
jgi:hypothetical protein